MNCIKSSNALKRATFFFCLAGSGRLVTILVIHNSLIWGIFKAEYSTHYSGHVMTKLSICPCPRLWSPEWKSRCKFFIVVKVAQIFMRLSILSEFFNCVAPLQLVWTLVSAIFSVLILIQTNDRLNISHVTSTIVSLVNNILSNHSARLSRSTKTESLKQFVILCESENIWSNFLKF